METELLALRRRDLLSLNLGVWRNLGYEKRTPIGWVYRECFKCHEELKNSQCAEHRGVQVIRIPFTDNLKDDAGA